MPLKKNITIKQLRSLIQVVETGSITRAAENLFLTAPAVSTQIKLLEQEAGAKVLQRRGQGMVPTDCGWELYDLARRLDVALETAEDRLGSLKAGKTGTVGVGVVSTAKYFMPRLLAAYQRKYPDVDLRLVIGNRKEVLTAMKNSVVDMVILGRTPNSIPIVYEYMGENPFGIIAPAHHPLASLRMVPASRLLSETIFQREDGSGTRAITQRYMEQYGSGRGYRSMDMNNNESIKQVVMAGLGLGMLSLHTVIHEVHEGRLAILRAPGLPIIRRWILVRLERQQLSDTARQCWDFIMNNLPAFMPNGDPFPDLAELTA